MSELSPPSDQPGAVAIRPARADEWSRWRETRLRMLRDDADFFSTRYDDMVREPDGTWREPPESDSSETRSVPMSPLL